MSDTRNETLLAKKVKIIGLIFCCSTMFQAASPLLANDKDPAVASDTSVLQKRVIDSQVMFLLSTNGDGGYGSAYRSDNGATCGDCAASLNNPNDIFLARGGHGGGNGNGNGGGNGGHGGNGPGDGTGNSGDGPHDGTGDGSKTGDCIYTS